jgi:hypothetical protein
VGSSGECGGRELIGGSRPCGAANLCSESCYDVLVRYTVGTRGIDVFDIMLARR